MHVTVTSRMVQSNHQLTRINPRRNMNSPQLSTRWYSQALASSPIKVAVASEAVQMTFSFQHQHI